MLNSHPEPPESGYKRPRSLGCLFLLTGFAAGIIVAVVIQAGALRSWQRLPPIPEIPVSILAGAVDSYPGDSPYRGRVTRVFVQTISDNVYASSCASNGAAWQKVQKDEVVEVNFRDCRSNSAEPARQLKGEIDNYEINWCGEWDSGVTVYAIREDGTVWRWTNYGRFPDWFLSLFGGSAIGTMVGFVIWRKRVAKTTKRVYPISDA